MDKKINVDFGEVSERERQLLEQERIVNAELDAKLLANHDRFPKAVYFILPNELGERFCFYGIKNLLNNFLKKYHGMNEHTAKAQVHLFNGLAYLTPLMGAALSDSFLGKYHAIIYLSIIYVIGNTLLSIFSIPNLIAPIGNFPYYTYIIPMLLIAIGTGGIKPCVSSHGGDQFLPTQAPLLDRFFSFFFISINIGALISQYLTPFLKEKVSCFGDTNCYFLAYGVPTIVFAIALVIFIFGHRYYRIVPAIGEFLPWKALKAGYLGYKRYRSASEEERKAIGHWIQFAAPEYGEEFCEETRLLGKVCVILAPMAFYWALYDQNSTEWQNQYELMNHQFFGAFDLPTEASSNINSILIILFVPFLAYYVYPPLEKRGYKINMLNRMIIGYFLVILSFVISVSLEYSVQANKTLVKIVNGVAESCEGCVNGTWQIPQYIVLSLGESFCSPTGVAFAYTQVGRQMKASSTSIWLVAVALGNYVVMLLEYAMEGMESSTTRNWIYIAISSFFWIVLVLLAKFWYINKEDEDAAREMEMEISEIVKD